MPGCRWSRVLPCASQGTLRTEEFVGRWGFPLLVKAAAGGGGRGMRLVNGRRELESDMELASREAQAAFGDGRIFLERYVAKPRHVEVQVMADEFGHTIHLGERECSIQRRHQKIIEETPSPGLTPELRRTMEDAAIAVARRAGYANAGTVEFLLDPAERRVLFPGNECPAPGRAPGHRGRIGVGHGGMAGPYRQWGTADTATG